MHTRGHFSLAFFVEMMCALGEKVPALKIIFYACTGGLRARMQRIVVREPLVLEREKIEAPCRSMSWKRMTRTLNTSTFYTLHFTFYIVRVSAVHISRTHYLSRCISLLHWIVIHKLLFSELKVYGGNFYSSSISLAWSPSKDRVPCKYGPSNEFEFFLSCLLICFRFSNASEEATRG